MYKYVRHCRRSSAWESTRPDLFRSEAEDRAVVSSNLTDGTSTFREIVKNILITLPLLIKMVFQVLRRVFCTHGESFSFRLYYNDVNFKEYNKCSKCGKILRYLKGYDEDMRG